MDGIYDLDKLIFLIFLEENCLLERIKNQGHNCHQYFDILPDFYSSSSDNCIEPLGFGKIKLYIF